MASRDQSGAGVPAQTRASGASAVEASQVQAQEGQGDAPWTLAERFARAHLLAARGDSLDTIIEVCGIAEFTAICIINRHRPGEISTLDRNCKDG
jgi:hypothetical protein